jgi:hypothetical protein
MTGCIREERHRCTPKIGIREFQGGLERAGGEDHWGTDEHDMPVELERSLADQVPDVAGDLDLKRSLPACGHFLQCRQL